ncbi:glycosyltransferase involved in cell wall biosynthesis [Limnobacter thiooxidans]|uniref:Glycosyltransferase family 2 protein n=1 Tax=Limnobacter thiooxidans TaxID=131080 RepID=A0AA86MH70_9BURK|nr:glycosyltransferase family 2 protein [Limnobacter sp.]MCZ8017051.1 glycosyltransferase family 2 protein [Limnobacter sp.]RZS38770.1 glycosyltransferase involved in cell wall biosynthesis [Limnobacter thiooxidans]BET24777.1 glycosyltransferase family 2 protein [Limnobacter thiooxidans]
MNLTVIILTKNEEIHLERCLSSVRALADEILIVDCGSTDKTIEIANNFKARVEFNTWRNYSSQFGFGLSQVNPSCKWVMRLDADEYLTPALQESVVRLLSSRCDDTRGAYFPRRMAFLGRMIKHGGIFPAEMLRLFRNGFGRIEDRWMDEHIKVEGKTVVLDGELVDDNLNSLTWWIEKHNKYSSREAVDLLNLEFEFMSRDSVGSLSNSSEASLKRWVKEVLYSRLPMGTRALLYFIYRYFVRLGFLDGREGSMFHFLQGFWYRYLADCKVYEVKQYVLRHNCDVKVAIREVLGIEV